MAIEMRKRPVISGQDALKFLKKAEKNKQHIFEKKSAAMKRWNEQLDASKD